MSETAPDLTAEELIALKQIGDARASVTVAPGIRERLISRGYAKDVLGVLTITDEGMLRIITGK